MGSVRWTSSKALPWDVTALPQSPAGKGNDLCMSWPQHDIILNPTNFWWWWWWGGVIWNFHKQKGESANFLLLPRGTNNLIESFIPFLSHPRELKNDNSLTHFCRVRDGGGVGRPPPPNNNFWRTTLTPTNYISKGNLSESTIHFRYRQNILISRIYKQISRNAPQRLLKKFQTLKIWTYYI